jgi:glycosyltransferase involved in cell wall biosynthesis
MLSFVPPFYVLKSFCIPRLAPIFAKHLERLVSGPIDIVNNIRVGRENLSVASWQFARKRKVPFVFTPLHHPRWQGWLYRNYLELYRRADALLALTKYEKELCIKLGVPADRIHVTGVGPVLASQAHPENFRQKYGIGDRPFVLYLGQKYAYKGIAALVRAARLLASRLPDLLFVFIGPRTRYSQVIFKTQGKNNIVELPPLDLQEKTDALAACSVLCLPSQQESFGVVFVEAWNFQKPVIGGNIPVIAEVISDGVDGFLVSQEAGEIASKIETLIREPSLAAKMGEEGFKKAQASFSWKKTCETTLKAYQSLL